MKKAVLIGGIVLALLLFSGTVWFYFYSVRDVPVGDQLIPVTAQEIVLEGTEAEDPEGFVALLKPFRQLKKLDLGSYAVEAREEAALLAAFPGVELKYSLRVSLYGLTVPADAEELDLTGADLSDLAPLRDALPYLSGLKSVTSDAVLPRAALDRLRADFPGVDFRIVSEVTAFGRTLRDDVTELDLRDAQTEDLADQLRLLPSLTAADLRGSSLSAEGKLALAKAFPQIAFRWEVTLLGEVYDSYTEELNFAGNPDATAALMEKTAPLFPKLTRLDMTDCLASDEEMGALQDALPGVKVVWRVRMGDFTLKTDDLTFAVLIRKGDKRRQITDEDLKKLKYCTELQALDLGHQAITDISVIGEYLPELRVLILADNSIADISPLAKLRHLHYIELFVNSKKLTDLSPLAACRELVDVNVSYLPGVKDFSPLYDLPLLERLWLEHSSVTKEQLNELQTRHPDATIISVGEGSVDQGWRTHDRYFAMIDMFHNNYISEEFTKYDR